MHSAHNIDIHTYMLSLKASFHPIHTIIAIIAAAISVTTNMAYEETIQFPEKTINPAHANNTDANRLVNADTVMISVVRIHINSSFVNRNLLHSFGAISFIPSTKSE